MTAGARLMGIKNSCQPPRSRSHGDPDGDCVSTYRLAGGGEPRAYRDPQWGGSMNFGWTKGGHNVKFGGEMKLLHQNHYETQSPMFTFTGGRTALAPARAEQLQRLCGLPAGRDELANARRSMTPMIGDRTDRSTICWTSGRRRCAPWQFGTYIRDQFELNRKMTVSVGVRWEYYPLSQPRRPRSRGVRFHGQTSCSSAASPEIRTRAASRSRRISSRRGSAGRIGPPNRPSFASATRAIRRTTRRAANQMPPFQAFPATIIYTETAANTYTAIGSLQRRGHGRAAVRSDRRACEAGQRRAHHLPLNEQFVRGTISSWNVSMQQLLPYEHSLTLGYVANRQNGITRSLNQNYGQLGGGNASQPYRADYHHGDQRPGPLRPSELRLVAGEREQADDQGVAVHRRLHLLRRRSTGGPGTIPQPEYWYLNKGEQANSNPHLLNTSVIYELPFGTGTEIPDGLRRGLPHLRRWQIERVLHRAIRDAVHRDRQQRVAERGHRHQPDAPIRLKTTSEIHGFGNGGAYFDVTGVQAGHRGPLWHRRRELAARARLWPIST